MEATIGTDIGNTVRVGDFASAVLADVERKGRLAPDRQLQYGDHVAHVYSGEEERIAFTARFFNDTVERGDKCIYFMHSGKLDGILFALEKKGFAARRHLLSGAMAISGCKDMFYSNGVFSPDAVLANHRKHVLDAQSKGYAGVGILSDMGWVLGAPEGVERLMEYEARMNHQSKGLKAVMVCQYHQGLFQPEIIFNVMQTHPVVIKSGTSGENPYFLAPEVFLASASARISVDLLVGGERPREWHDKKTIGRTREEFKESLKKFGLTPQEQKVVERILLFRSNHEMAQELYISDNTVKQHIKNIYRKMGISKRLELVAQFMKLLESD